MINIRTKAHIRTKAQSWSLDIALGLIVFIVSFFIFYIFINASPTTKVSNLKDEGSLLIKQVASEEAPLRIIDSNEINISRLNDLKNLNYDELKRRLRIEGDFCIYLEDESGFIVIINNSYKGVGAPTINLSGTPCSQK